MAEQALRDNGVLSRFASDDDMARWLTRLLNWNVDTRTLRRAKTRFRTRDNNKEEDPRYIDFVDFYREKTILYHQLEKELLANTILGSKGVK